MAVKVLYKQGTKATYLGLSSRQSNALYFCTDTRELFKGNDLYSDGLRIVASYNMLPAFAKAADGILYFCEDNGCGYVLNAARNAWLPVVHGVDNDTVGFNESGLIAVKSVPIAKVKDLAEELKRIEALAISGNKDIPVATHEVAGIVKPGSEFDVGDDGTLSLKAVAIEKVSGLEEILSKHVEKDEVRAVAEMVKYEIDSKPEGAIVRYSESEIRVMCPEGTAWSKQNVGPTGNSNMHYMSFKAYAPEGAVSFKEGDRGVIVDEMFTFDHEFAGTDEYGRNYSICWLALASYDEATDTWTYFGKNSTAEKYIGWSYVVEWYDKNGIMIGTGDIRINLSNESCHYTTVPYYIGDLQKSIRAAEEATTWSNM